MPQQANIVQEGMDRVRETVSSIENDFERVQKRIRARRKKIEKKVASNRKKFEKELRKNTYIKRAQNAFDDAAKQFEKGVDGVLGVLNVASKRDLNRIDRKLNQINRKLREIEKAKPGNGASRDN